MKQLPPKKAFRTEESSADLSYMQIERHFRRELASGNLKEGDRLPSNAALAAQFNVSGWTIQNALARLASEGLIERARRRGTFVKATESRTLIGVLFGPSLAEESAYFYRKILRTMRQEMLAFNWDCRFYDDLTDGGGVPRPVNSPVFQHLLSDFRNYPFKGIIEFATGAKELEVLEEQSGLPHVRFADNETDLRFDNSRSGAEIANLFITKGRKKIAILTTGSALSRRVVKKQDEKSIREVAKNKGLCEPRVERVLINATTIDLQEESIFQQCLAIVKRWTARKEAELPDALFIDDDIIARSMAMALVHFGVDIPNKLLVLTLANEGIDFNYGIPMYRYEFSPREVSKTLLDLLWRRMMGRSTPPLPVILPGKIVEASGPVGLQRELVIR